MEKAWCPMCQPEHVGGNHSRNLSLEPANCPAGPFCCCSMDLDGPFPPDDSGNKYMSIAVDMFSKWVKATAIPDKRAFTTAAWFYDAVVCCWGQPELIKLDHGIKREAEQLHITVRQATMGNICANRQVERMIKTLKLVIRRYLGIQPTLE